ncbi:hypothetical protein FA15DRAFT_624697 [Coprinopsis marcescibilis]|uniref:Uncharacterized protein n=1 Tax=Coprinopsis marcescibilis TaxID=230819 RepID=A0A5C3KY95_COPMA|nr:hypothetical protein FA15DRAFT_624697 [Coprinopsis marcescibilis]
MAKVISTTSHGPGATRLTFSKDGSHLYTGGEDCIVRIWDLERGPDHEPTTASDSEDAITWIATTEDCWVSTSRGAEVRRYAIGATISDGLVTMTGALPARCVTIDPKGRRVAVASEEHLVRVVDLEDTTSIQKLEQYSTPVRTVTWHPSGNLLTTCTSDGKIVIWDLSGDEPKLEKTIDGIVPVVKDHDSPEFSYDCSAVWHPSGQHFYIASKTHEIVVVSRSSWAKVVDSHFVDKDALGEITALAISPNGLYLVSAAKSTIFVWSILTKRLVSKASGTQGASITQVAFSPKHNFIAWTDSQGGVSRWESPVPTNLVDPIKITSVSDSVAATTAAPSTSGSTRKPTLFEDEDKMEEDDVLGADIDLDEFDLDKNFIDDDVGGYGDDDEPARQVGSGGLVKEMVSITKAQLPFQPGATPFAHKKRYLAFNMLGVIESTEQDVHNIINVVFFNQTDRSSFHFTDHFKNDMAYLGECGAVFACPPEAERHPARVLFKPYSPTASEWSYNLRPGTRVLALATGGLAPKGGLRSNINADLQGYGHVVLATSENDLTFLTGTGRERRILALGGDVVTMVASPEWVFVVHRPGSTTIDGSQNLYYTVINFDDFSVRQRDVLPVPKGHTLKWVGLTEEGLPAMYDSTGYLHVLSKVRTPHHAAWVRILDTNLLDRREGKEESYWPVGVSDGNFMCLILKGRQEYPGFPRPLMQELPITLPFRQAEPNEEQVERNLFYVQTALDALDEDLTTETIASREQAIDKEFILLIQAACKSANIPRAIELVKLLHNIPSFDASIAIANFYNLQGLKEKMQYLKREKEEDEDRLVVARNKRRRWLKPDAQLRQVASETNGFGARYDPLGDTRPPQQIERPGMSRVTKPVIEKSRFSSAAPSTQAQRNKSPEDAFSSTPWIDDQTMRDSPPPVEKRKRDEVEDSFPSSSMPPPKAKFNPFARKSAPDTNKNPFSRSNENNRSLHKSESFFDKVDAAETQANGKKRTTAKGKEKDTVKTAGPRQTTLFSMLPQKRDKAKKPEASANEDVAMSDAAQETLPDDWEETQLLDVDSQNEETLT